MGFFGDVANRVRDYFRRDKEQVGVQIAKGATASGYPTTGYDLLQAYGYDVLSDFLKLEHDLMCVSGDTRVFVLNDGPRWIPIRELAEQYRDRPDDPIYTLSFDRVHRKLVVSKAYRPRKTKHEQTYYVVMVGSTRDSEHSYVISATANHPFLMRDGLSYKRVDELKPGDSVMPAGTSMKTSVNGPYWYVFQPFQFTESGKHSKQDKLSHLVVESVFGRRPGKGEVVHHKNSDKSCDAPWNLEIKTEEGHHGDHSKELWANPEWRKEQAKRVASSKSGRGGVSTIEKRRLGSRSARLGIEEANFRKLISESASINEAAKTLGVNWWTVKGYMRRFGVDSDLLGSTLNHKVVAILPAGEEDVYDLTVPEYENFAAEGVIIHNSRYIDYEEMDDFPEISTAITIFADDATQPESTLSRTVWVTSKDHTIAQILDDLYHRTLRMDEEIWEIARTVVKYGQDYEEILVTDEGVKGLNFMAPPTVRRIEGPRGELFGFVQDFKGRFGYCLARGSRVWSPSGLQEIQDFSARSVLGYKDGKVVPFRLQQRHTNGTKKVFRVRTRHREVYLTEDHPVLAERANGTREWVKVKDLKIVRYQGYKRNIDYSRSDKLVICTHMPPREVSEWSSIWKFDPFETRWGHKGSPKTLVLPERPTPEFCRLFGFLLGDGWTEGMSEGGTSDETYKHTHHKGEDYEPDLSSTPRVSYARGVYPELNDLYDSLLASLGLEVKVNKEGTQSRVNSVQFVRLLHALGWIDGAENRRVPSWLFSLPQEHREAFLTGFIDADGWDTQTSAGLKGHHFEIANYNLTRDLKNLIDGLGYRSGNIGSRQREPGTVITNKKTGRTVTIATQEPCFNLHYSLNKFEQPFVAENLVEISYHEDAEVFDLEVEDEAHNFVADGVVVHNSPAEFQQIMANRAAMQQGGSSKAGFGGMEKVSALEDWEVVHFRLRGKHRRSIYGFSVLEPARWIWKRLMLLEDAAMVYRLQRAPERYAFYVDVGDLPPQEAYAYLNKIRQQHRKKKWVNPQTGKLDLKFDPMPVAASTPVPLLDGRTVTIEEMAKEHAEGRKHWVYSVDRGTGQAVPGEVSWVGMTRSQAPAVRVTFDDGGHMDLAPDHPVMRRSGAYVNASDLKPGDSVMPFYRKESSIEAGNRLDGYELLYNPASARYRYTHRLVAEALFTLPKTDVVHHRDLTRKNNDPSNLQPMTRKDHAKLHATLGNLGGKAIAELRKVNAELDIRLRAAAAHILTEFNKRPEQRAKTSRRNRETDSGRFIRAYNISDKHVEDNVVRSESKRAMWADSKRRAKAQANMRLKFPDEFVEGLRSLICSNPGRGAEDVVRSVNRGLVGLLGGLNTRKVLRVHRHMLLKLYRRLGYAGFEEFKTFCLQPNNHKVVSVAVIEPTDQYCMTVEKWHNFALLLRSDSGEILNDSGVFVKNSQEEDFFIPVRQGAEGTRIEVLGAPSWQSMQDIEYFRDKLFAAVGVPKAYLAQTEGVNRQILSSEDVRFARSVLRVQRELRNGLGKVARVHLAALNIDPSAVEFALHMTVPSAIFELAQLEVKNARADLAARMGEYVSKHWVMSTLFSMSDDEIETIFREKDEDAERDAYTAASTQSIIQKAVAEAGAEGQAQGQVDAQNIIQTQTSPEQLAAQQAMEQPKPKKESRISGPLIRIKEPVRRTYYDRERKLFEGGNPESERRALEKMDKLLRSDRFQSERLVELGQMLRELSQAVGEGQRRR